MLLAAGPVEDILAEKIREYQALNEQVRCCSWTVVTCVYVDCVCSQPRKLLFEHMQIRRISLGMSGESAAARDDH